MTKLRGKVDAGLINAYREMNSEKTIDNLIKENDRLFKEYSNAASSLNTLVKLAEWRDGGVHDTGCEKHIAKRGCQCCHDKLTYFIKQLREEWNQE